MVLVTKRTTTHQTLLIVTKRGNAHHYTSYQQTGQCCRGRKKERPAGEKKTQETLCLKPCQTSPVNVTEVTENRQTKSRNKEGKCMKKLTQSTQLIKLALKTNTAAVSRCLSSAKTTVSTTDIKAFIWGE